MAEKEVPPTFDALAEQLRAEAEELTDRWLTRLGERLGVRPRRLLPTAELRDHVPDVLRGAADYLSLPISSLPNETVDILRTLAQLRREQGYDIQEILLEVDVLSDLVFECAAEWVAEVGIEGGEAMRAAARLSEVLRNVASVAVGTFREEELRHGRELATRLSDFAGTIAHEILNPLNTAGISVTLLTKEEVASDPQKREKHTRVIRDRIDRIHHLVDDLRALAVAEGARAEARWIPMRDVIRDVLEEVREAAERQGVRLEVEEPIEEFEVDAVRVEIALMNLVSNAIKFSDPEKEERWVRIATGPAESSGLQGGRRIIVEDNGRGIQAESQNKVSRGSSAGSPRSRAPGWAWRSRSASWSSVAGSSGSRASPGKGPPSRWRSPSGWRPRRTSRAR